MTDGASERIEALDATIEGLRQQLEKLRAEMDRGRNGHDVGEQARAAEYPALVRRVRAMIQSAVPSGAIVAVVAKGDPQLVDVPGRQAWHFHRDGSGRYAGHHPSDDEAAIAHLGELQSLGAGFLAFPATSRWWLDHYVELAAHLETHHVVVVDDPGTGMVYALSGGAGRDPGARRQGVCEDQGHGGGGAPPRRAE